MSYLDGLRLYVEGYAKSRGVKLSKADLKEVLSDVRQQIDSDLETAIHNSQTDFVC